MTTFLAIVALMTLAAVAVVAVPLLGNREHRSPVAALVAALAIPGAVLFLYATQSSYPWQGATAGPADSEAIEALRSLTEASPADAAAWTALGDGLIAEQRFAEARDAYARALRTGNPEDDALRLSYAEATILADRNALAGEAAEIIEAVLARDPVNAKALWYGGMVALGRGDTAVARDRWTRLLALEPPPQVREIIAEQVARLDGGAAPADAGARIPLRISVDPALAPRIQPGATLFLFARAGEGGGPPLAVARRDAGALPIDTELSDADSMVPGRSLAGAGEVRVTARVANDGEALAAPGDVYGEAVWRPGQGLVEIRMDRLVE